tara:strand:+ start:1819 stop:2544 length:726 start_codon:yes stop_codon:yes gene_type:complete
MSKLDRGIAEYIKPMPNELWDTSSPASIISEKEYQDQQKKIDSGEKVFNKGLTKQMSDDFKARFGADNWYLWALNNWGTKWGCYDSEMDGKSIRFTTAWSPLDVKMIEEFAKLVPTFIYSYEEETGWGGWMEFENGVCISEREYSEPRWDDEKTFVINDNGVIKESEGVWNKETNTMEYEEGFKYLCSVSELLEEHDNGDVYSKGWYESYSLHEYYGKSLKDVFQWHTHKDRKDNQPIIFG